MCCNTFKIKPVNPSASKRIFCQCGFCEDCRKSERNMWSFRLQAEILGRQAQGWNVGFLTMTYNDDNLPHFGASIGPDENWREVECEVGMPCFSRSDIRNFILRLRKYLWKHYNGITGISYMICSELGDDTQRPHYHAIFSWPPIVDYKTMYEIIESLWCDKGFLFPKNYLGGVDKYGHNHKPFAVDCAADAARYCAKYVCKDLTFYNECFERGINVKDKYFRKECAPFHIQNRGLGQQFLATLSESDKVRMLTDGFSFIGESFLRSCPVYFRNKLIFDTHYVYDIYTHNRLVRRYANAFFESHKEVIYHSRLKTYTHFFEQIKRPEYSLNRLSEFLHTTYSGQSNYDDVIQVILDNLDFVRDLDARTTARYYLSYYKVPIQYRLADPVESWYNHYVQQPVKTDLNLSVKESVCDNAITCALLAMQFVHNPVAADKALVDYVSDFHKSMEY